MRTGIELNDCPPAFPSCGGVPPKGAGRVRKNLFFYKSFYPPLSSIEVLRNKSICKPSPPPQAAAPLRRRGMKENTDGIWNI